MTRGQRSWMTVLFFAASNNLSRLRGGKVDTEGSSGLHNVYYAYLFQSLSDFRLAKLAYCMPKTHSGWTRLSENYW